MGNSIHELGANATQDYASGVDRIVRKEVALGQIREILPPQNHIGIAQIAPFLEVESDDVVFDYITASYDGLAPARAEDAESELARKDETISGSGRASVIDWALKDHYTASDVARYREFLQLANLAAGREYPLTIKSGAEQFARKVARDDARRRRKLDNRLEWLIMTGLHAGAIAYNDTRIKFSVDYGRPAGQQAQAPASGTYAADTHDPINDMLAVQTVARDTLGVEIERAIVSKKFLLRAAASSKFGLRGGYVPNGSGGVSVVDPRYLIDGYGPDYAINLLGQQTGIEFITYDSTYRAKNASGNIVNTRFVPENRVIFLPSEASLAEFDDTEIGFAKTLTSPHPEGDWSPGFYEWEQSTKDPWGVDRGSGIKAFPAFLHLDKTFTWDVTL